MFSAALAEQRPVGSVALGQLDVEAVVEGADCLVVQAQRKPLGGVRADRLEHVQSGRRVCHLAAYEQAFGDQLLERVEAGERHGPAASIVAPPANAAKLAKQSFAGASSRYMHFNNRRWKPRIG